MNRILMASVLAFCFSGPAMADNWPAWRGAAGTGVAGESDLPTRFSSTENVTWKAPLPGPGNSTPIGDGVLIGISGFQKSMMAVRMGGRGDVTATHRLWLVEMTQQRIGSGVVRDGCLFVSNAPGICECILVKTGETVWKERLGGDLWGSILLAGDHLYVSNKQGEVFVLAASPSFELVAKNTMGEHIKAAIAPSDGQLFIRTYENLYCVGQRKR